MHEMSIALSIIDLATEQAQKENARKIVEIELDIGAVSGVEIEALNFALEMAVKETLLESALVKVNRIEAVSECLECGHHFESMHSHQSMSPMQGVEYPDCERPGIAGKIFIDRIKPSSLCVTLADAELRETR